MNDKKARRKARRQKERQAHRDLDAVTSDAVEQALQFAPLVVESGRTQTIDVELVSSSEAQFVRKRINEALRVDEWLEDMAVEIVDRADKQLELRMVRTIS